MKASVGVSVGLNVWAIHRRGSVTTVASKRSTFYVADRRLAVNSSMQGRGLGVALLQDAVLRVRQAGAIMGIRGVVVHAISEEARAFYEHHGFIPSVTNPLTLILSVARGPTS